MEKMHSKSKTDIKTPPLKMCQKWFSSQNEANDTMFQMEQITTVLTFYLWRNWTESMV